MKSSRIGLVAFFAGLAIAIIGLGAYQAWWTIAFAFGGVAVALLSSRGMAAGRLIGVGAGLTVAVLLAGMSVFLLYGSGWGGPPWLAASIGSILISTLLILLARRLYRGAPIATADPRDIARH